jgi:hypothetical protein
VAEELLARNKRGMLSHSINFAGFQFRPGSGQKKSGSGTAFRVFLASKYTDFRDRGNFFDRCVKIPALGVETCLNALKHKYVGLYQPAVPEIPQKHQASNVTTSNPEKSRKNNVRTLLPTAHTVESITNTLDPGAHLRHPMLPPSQLEKAKKWHSELGQLRLPQCFHVLLHGAQQQ